MAKHVGKLVDVNEREHRAECSCGWVGLTLFGVGSATREHDKHLDGVLPWPTPEPSEQPPAQEVSG